MRKVRWAFLVALFFPSIVHAIELYPQLGHNDAVKSVAFSPDGRYVLSGSSDKTLRLWEVSSGKEIRSFSGHSSKVTSVAFSPDGKYVLSGSWDKTLKLWEVSTGKEVRSFSGHSGRVTSVAFSPNGKYVLSGSSDKTLKLWEVSSGNEIRSFIGHARGVRSIALSPDGKYALSGGWDKTLKLWEVSTGKEIRSFTGHSSEVQSVAFSPDGSYSLSGSDSGRMKLWEVSSGKEIRSFAGGAESVVFSPDGEYALSGDYRTMKLWEVSSGKKLRSFTVDYPLTSVAFSPDGKHALSGGYGDTLTLWEVSSGKEIRSFAGQSNAVQSVAFSPDGKYLLSGGDDNTLKLWEVSIGKKLRSFTGHSSWVNSVAFSPNGKYALSGSYDSRLKLWKVSTGKEIRSFTGYPDMVMTSVTFSPDGKYALSGNEFSTMELWEVSTGKKLRSFDGHSNPVNSVAFSPDGKYLLSGSHDGTLKLWKASTGKEIRSFDGDASWVHAVAFSPDGKYVLSGYEFSALKLWEVSTGKEMRSFTGHPGSVTSVAFSPDGEYVLSGGDDKTLKLWKVSTGKEIRSFTGHSGTVTSVAFSPDGKYLLSGSKDTTMRLWRVDTGDSMAMVSNREGEWLLYTDDGLFDSSPRGTEMVAMVDGMHGYNIDQLALKNNRPDLILERMGLGTPELIKHYKKRYLKRLEKAGLSEEDLSGALENLPESTIREARRLDAEAALSLTLEDQKGLLSYQVYVNGVPLYEGLGKEVSGKRLDLTEKLALTPGENRIEISALNTGGQESFRALAVLEGPKEQPKELYFLGFGVSSYQDPGIPDLSYSHKDALDLAEAFGGLQGYEEVHLKTYTNEEVTKAKLKAAKEFFARARPQDTVVLFIAGHGLYDQDELATYYYLTHDAKLDDLAGTAASFEDIEALLSGLSARQKLFLMDTCESGERDDSQVTAVLKTAKSRGLGARAVRGIYIGKEREKTKTQKSQKTAGEKRRPWLLERDRYIYQDLARRTGAMVFSSSQGTEFSYESRKLKNGLFTEALLEGLSKKAADQDKDGQISRKELKRYVIEEVSSLSRGLQHPTVDRDNPLLRLSFVP